MKFAFIAKHRGIWPAGWLCGALGVSRGGFYAWLTRPRSERSRSDEELSVKMRMSFLSSDRTYGARRVWHDVLAEGARCGLHRIERLMRQQGLKARPRRRRLPPDLGERQAAAAAPNVLDRTFKARSQPPLDRRLHLCLDSGGLALRGCRHRPVLAAGGGVVDECRDDRLTCYRCAGDGDLATRQAGCAAASLRSRQPVHQRAVPVVDD
ncbi:HTH-like domain-containing protein [Bradyrhizobium brasilense]|uniref:HTH-like domain-containing protein n=1 Tax=Bradyrhizobium brasilense TaxID=1419277 RepID=A0A1G7ANP4_9BRAD|nr:HTH-like domain-containing protein [Bradyrhizobium brasilense]